MARRKEEAALLREIETQEEWEDMLSKDGVTMVDVFAEWCGPCKGLQATLRRIKNELGDDLLKYAAAKSDHIESLENYRNKSEPCFLFYAGGVLVAVIRGANCPLIIRTIKEQVANEHKVIDGSTERKEIIDLVIASTADLDIKASELSVPYEEQRDMTVCIIKPDAVRSGQVEDILQELEDAGIDVMRHEERNLTEIEARKFYAHLEDELYFEDYIKFMISGPTHVLLLAHADPQEDIVKNFRNLLGPPSVEEARDVAPTSLRAKYGSKNFMNALHGSDSPETAAREMAFFFPYAVTKKKDEVKSKPAKPKIQRTLALIRPDVLAQYRDEIIAKVEEAGFYIAIQKEVQLTKEQAMEFYKEHEGTEYFDDLTDKMSSGPLLALGLAREDAVNKWREFIGPKEAEVAKEVAPETLRAQFPSEAMNAVHGSDSMTAASKELEFFFPVEKTVAAIKPDAFGTKEEIIHKIHDAGFKIAARKETQLTREMAEQFYADQKDTDHFEELVEAMISGNTYFMVLTREDAIEGWRKMVGPTDPEVARTEEPETLRAIYGVDLAHNAVHGSIESKQVDDSIQQIFGEILPTQIYVLEEEEEEAVAGEEEPAGEQEPVEESAKPPDEAVAPTLETAPAIVGEEGADLLQGGDLVMADTEAVEEPGAEKIFDEEGGAEQEVASAEAVPETEQIPGVQETEEATTERVPSAGAAASSDRVFSPEKVESGDKESTLSHAGAEPSIESPTKMDSPAPEEHLQKEEQAEQVHEEAQPVDDVHCATHHETTAEPTKSPDHAASPEDVKSLEHATTTSETAAEHSKTSEHAMSPVPSKTPEHILPTDHEVPEHVTTTDHVTTEHETTDDHGATHEQPDTESVPGAADEAPAGDGTSKDDDDKESVGEGDETKTAE